MASILAIIAAISVAIAGSVAWMAFATFMSVVVGFDGGGGRFRGVTRGRIWLEVRYRVCVVGGDLFS